MSDPVQTAGTGPPGALARPDWRAGGALTASALNLEQRYRGQRLRRHLRLGHGWGIVCGLTVAPAGEDWLLFICPGYGISPCGDEISVTHRYRFNLRDYLWTRPLQGDPGDSVWIALEAAGETISAPSSDAGCGCGCSGHDQATDAQVSLASNGFRVAVSWTAPASGRSAFDICTGVIPPCPPCPEECGLTLARVTLPASLYRPGALLNSDIANVTSGT
jgi:hypothetical protein